MLAPPFSLIVPLNLTTGRSSSNGSNDNRHRDARYGGERNGQNLNHNIERANRATKTKRLNRTLISNRTARLMSNLGIINLRMRRTRLDKIRHDRLAIVKRALGMSQVVRHANLSLAIVVGVHRKIMRATRLTILRRDRHLRVKYHEKRNMFRLTTVRRNLKRKLTFLVRRLSKRRSILVRQRPIIKGVPISTIERLTLHCLRTTRRVLGRITVVRISKNGLRHRLTRQNLLNMNNDRKDLKGRSLAICERLTSADLTVARGLNYKTEALVAKRKTNSGRNRVTMRFYILYDNRNMLLILLVITIHQTVQRVTARLKYTSLLIRSMVFTTKNM